MAEAESQHPWEMETGRLGRGGGPPNFPLNTALCQAMPVACLLFLQDFFFSVVWKKGPLLVPRNKHCPIRCLPLLQEFLFLFFCHGDGLFGPASP